MCEMKESTTTTPGGSSIVRLLVHEDCGESTMKSTPTSSPGATFGSSVLAREDEDCCMLSCNPATRAYAVSLAAVTSCEM